MPKASRRAAQRRHRRRSRRSRPTSTSARATASRRRLYDRHAARASGRWATGARLAARSSTRADSAPADIVPGLLAATLKEAGEADRRRHLARSPSLIAADRHGLFLRARTHARCQRGCPAVVCVVDAGLSELQALVRRLRGRRPADRARAPAAAARPPARGRDRGPRLRRQPHLRQHPHARLRALHRPRADDPRAGSGSRSPRRWRASRSAARGRSTSAPSPRSETAWPRSSHRRGPVIGVSALIWLALAGAGRARSAAARWRGRRCRCSPSARLPAARCCWSARRSSRSQAVERLILAARGAAARRDHPARLLPRLPGAGGRLRADGARLRDRRDRRLAAHAALADRARTRPSGCASTGSATSWRRRSRRWSWSAPARRSRRCGRGCAADARRRRLPRRRAASPPSSSPSGASAPTSARRSSCRSGGRGGGRGARQRRGARCTARGRGPARGLGRLAVARPRPRRQCAPDPLGARRRRPHSLADVAERRLRLSAHSFRRGRRLAVSLARR